MSQAFCVSEYDLSIEMSFPLLEDLQGRNWVQSAYEEYDYDNNP